MDLSIKFLLPQASAPLYMSDGAACFDFKALDLPDEGVMVYPGNPVVFRTGVAFAIPFEWGMFINSRSGHGFKFDVRLSNSTGIIDSDYTGEVMVKLAADPGGKPLNIRNGDCIAQGCLLHCPRVNFVVVDELPVTARGANGFGSTSERGDQ